jgi:hypothetical protein
MGRGRAAVGQNAIVRPSGSAIQLRFASLLRNITLAIMEA